MENKTEIKLTTNQMREIKEALAKGQPIELRNRNDIFGQFNTKKYMRVHPLSKKRMQHTRITFAPNALFKDEIRALENYQK